MAGVHNRPIVVWNITRTCNLHCAHCYASSQDEQYPGELDTDQAKAVLRDLSDYNVPVVLFSGGEPTIRPDLVELIAYANEQSNLNPLISTNGTLLTKPMLKRLADAGLKRAGISMDGMEAVHDKFRGSKGLLETCEFEESRLREIFSEKTLLAIWPQMNDNLRWREF